MRSLNSMKRKTENERRLINGFSTTDFNSLIVSGKSKFKKEERYINDLIKQNGYYLQKTVGVNRENAKPDKMLKQRYHSLSVEKMGKGYLKRLALP